MPTGPEMLHAVKAATTGLPQGSEHWLDVPEKLDLCKLKISDLLDAGYDKEKAETVAAALSQQDVRPLGDSMGLQLRVKFRVFAVRADAACQVRCERQENADWMKGYLMSCFPDSEVCGPQPIGDTPLLRIDVHFDNNATPFAVRQALLRCPAALLVELYEVRVAEQPHFRIEAYNLAAWLEDQDEEPWWTVDGDALLMSRLEFPAPPDELASELRKVERPLLVADPSGTAGGEELVPEDVDVAVETDEWGNRLLRLAWEGGTTDWQMIEDEPTSETY
jgi:hypothetical protein